MTFRLATRFTPGQTLGSTQLNRVVDLANELAKQSYGSFATRTGGVQTPFLCDIKALGVVFPYRLTCVFQGELANPQAFEFEVWIPGLFTEASRDFGGTIGLVSYVYTSINERDATNSGGTETQFVTPPFVVGETIQVTFLEDGLLTGMVPDGRMWAVDPA